MPDEFTGFPREAFTFWTKLAKNNTREWFHANKDVYERACRQPLQALIEELKPLYGPAKISRINRDMRFARGRPPYKDYIAAGIGNSYISLSQQGVWVGTGMYKPEPAVLARFRAAIDDGRSGRALAQLVRGLRRKGYDIDTHDTLASPPKGYAADHPRIDLLRMKDIYAGTMLPPKTLASPTALDRIVVAMRETEPLAKWLREFVGPRRGE